MITFFSEQHVRHAPQHEFFRGERVPCFESPARARFVQQQLMARGHVLREPGTDSRPVLALIHTSRYLAFLEGAWADWLALEPGNADRQPFPSVWPVRTCAATSSRRTSPPAWACTRWTTVRPSAPAPGRRPRPVPMRR
jgi:acetoin utilization deacetylase AcuC-like enzyme